MDKWQEVKVIDPTYPDRQSVQRIARKKLAEAAKSLPSKPRISLKRLVWTSTVGLLIIFAVVIIGIILSGNRIGGNIVLFLNSLVSTTYDNFDDPTFNGKINTSLWSPTVTAPSHIKQQAGVIELSIAPDSEEIVSLTATKKLDVKQANFVESKILLSSDQVGKDGDVSLRLMTKDNKNQNLIFWCGIGRSSIVQTWCEVYGRNVYGAEYSSEKIITTYDVWHTFRIEISPEINTIFYINGLRVGSYKPNDAEELRDKSFTIRLEVWSPSHDGIRAHFDEVWIDQNN